MRFATSETAHGTPPANNTVRARFMKAREFLRYCGEQGLPVPNLDPAWRKVRKSYPTTYGKVQAKNPARWLTKDEAFGKLLAACQDGTWLGSRDQLLCRLGLCGIRAHEIAALTVGDLDGTELRWIGKGRRPRHIILGPTTAQLIRRWLRQYERQLGRPLRRTDPLICPGDRHACRTKEGLPANHPGRIRWGQPTTTRTVRDAVQRRATTAGLGHLGPHDLRRSAAGIMHKDTGNDGGHRFDLYDIQRVLGHADPATTQRAYLDQLDTDAQQRAGRLLD